MQYNILPGALWECNTTEGNKDLDYSELWKLAEYEEDTSVPLDELDTMVIDIDLGHRIHLDRIEYRFDTNHTVSSSVASGITFSCKDESFDEYVSLRTFSNTNVYSTTVSGSIFAPRFIKLTHNVSETVGVTTITGSAFWIKAFNDEEMVAFGNDGTKTQENIEVARGAVPNIRAVPIYNNSPTRTTAYVNLEPQFENIDEAVSISTNPDGPWVYPLNGEDLIADMTNFGRGTLTSVDTNAGCLRLSSTDVSGGKQVTRYTSGYYTSRIIERGDNTYSRFLINKEENWGGRLVVDKEDPIDTIEIRSHNAPPAPYAVYRELYSTYENLSHRLRYRDRWLVSGAIKESSSWDLMTYYKYAYYQDYRIYYDNITDRWVGYIIQDGSSRDASLYLFTVIGSSFKNYRVCYQSDEESPVNFSWKEFRLDSAGGMWVYFYCQAYHSSDFVHSTGFYLAYFDHNLSNKFKWFSGQELVGSLDVDYTNKYLWYTLPGTGSIYKITHEGDILLTYVNEDVTGKLSALAVMPDGGIIYANGKDLHRLDYQGLYLSEYFMEDAGFDEIRYIVLDGDGSETIWVLDGMAIGLLYVSGDRKGTYDFRITVDYPVRMVGVEGGVWVHCADITEGGVIMRFVSKANRRVDKAYTPSYNSSPGIIYQTHTHWDYTDKMPLTIDPHWAALPWRKVAYEGYLSNEDRYYQLKLRFRRQEPIERYPEFVTDINQEFIYEDYVNQTSSIPDQMLWGDWINKPDLDRVYVDTSDEGYIVLVNDPGGEVDAYINTNNRMVGYRDDSMTLEGRIGFIIGEGNGVITGRTEYLYLYAYSVTPGKEGKWLGARLILQPNPSTTTNYIYVRESDSGTWYSESLGTSSNYYEGEIRLHWNSSENCYAQFRTPGGSFVGTYRENVYPSNYGNHFYFQIVSSRNSSPVKIKFFDLISGTPYYYTDSPRVTSMYKQELVELEDVYPNTSKDMYVRTYVPKDLELQSGHEMDMNVRWRVPSY